ncbi:MAG: glycosyltransferase family 2 protein [Microscillaceae bacterium]|nr:glycosyltransferase family 2 protein [Microscillaceae bacterium]MDW8460583.1 glycosyltransferase family 2 protein [Cytophagales bacterium]
MTEPVPTPFVAVVILNYNGRAFLEKFLPSVIQHSPQAQIFVADNASTDNSVAFLQEHFPKVRLVVLDKNYGFCQGYNLALQQIEAKYYVLLNSDVEVTKNWLVPLVELLEKNEKIGACQPKIKSFAQKQYFEHAGAAGGWIDAWGYPFCRGRVFDTIEIDKGQYNDEVPIFWATGACLAVRSRLFHQLGGLETHFFAHMEEIDLCWRLQNAGFEVWYSGKSEVYHVGGGTLPNNSPKKLFFNFRNNLLLLYKNLPRKHFFLVFGVRIFLDTTAFFSFIVKKQWANAWAIIRAYKAFFQLKNKVQKVSNPKPIQKLHGFYPKSVVWQYFFRQRKTFSRLK